MEPKNRPIGTREISQQIPLVSTRKFGGPPVSWLEFLGASIILRFWDHREVSGKNPGLDRWNSLKNTY